MTEYALALGERRLPDPAPVQPNSGVWLENGLCLAYVLVYAWRLKNSR
ncbi:MAG: hypothetical protein ACE5MM_03245 [Nitrospiraceae bacterium]